MRPKGPNTTRPPSPGSPAAAPQGLCAARPRGRVHRQGQSHGALRRCRWRPRPTKRKGGQFVLHTKARHGNSFDGHTLGPVVADARCVAPPRSNRSLAISRPSTGWAAITSNDATATAAKPRSLFRLQLQSAGVLAREVFAPSNPVVPPNSRKNTPRLFFKND
jgi:hypothetical protein